MTKTAAKYNKQVLRVNRELKLVKLSLMKVSTVGQRELRPEWVEYLIVNFDLDKLGTPEVSHRDGVFYIMDGQHRIAALKRWLEEGWEDQHVQCWVAEGLTEEQEAEYFLGLNDRKGIESFQKFKVSVQAGREAETEISHILKEEGLRATPQQIPGAVGAVGTLLKVYRRNGPGTLQRALHLAKEAYGSAGMISTVLDGFGLLCHRYNGVLDQQSAVRALAGAHGGVNGLLNSAEMLRQKTGSSKAQCVAASAVTLINRNRDGKKHRLTPWFKD